MKILIIDDSSTVRILIKSFLTEAGYNDLITAENAKDAFEILKIDPTKKHQLLK